MEVHLGAILYTAPQQNLLVSKGAQNNATKMIMALEYIHRNSLQPWIWVHVSLTRIAGGDACNIRPVGPRCSFPLHVLSSGQNRGSRATSENNQLKKSFCMMRYWKVRIYLHQTHNTTPCWSLPLPNAIGGFTDLRSTIQGRKIGSIPIIIWCFILLHFWVCFITNDVAMFFS